MTTLKLKLDLLIEQLKDNSPDLNKPWMKQKTSSDWTICRFHETPAAKSISHSDDQRTEQSLSRLCRTCWCNLNLYFWGELFLTLWPRHARWTLTMTDLSAAFLLWSLVHEWATGRELLCRHRYSGFLSIWARMRLLSWHTCLFLVLNVIKQTYFTCISAQAALWDNILFTVNYGIIITTLFWV